MCAWSSRKPVRDPGAHHLELPLAGQHGLVRAGQHAQHPGQVQHVGPGVAGERLAALLHLRPARLLRRGQGRGVGQPLPGLEQRAARLLRGRADGVALQQGGRQPLQLVLVRPGQRGVGQLGDQHRVFHLRPQGVRVAEPGHRQRDQVRGGRVRVQLHRPAQQVRDHRGLGRVGRVEHGRRVLAAELHQAQRVVRVAGRVPGGLAVHAQAVQEPPGRHGRLLRRARQHAAAGRRRDPGSPGPAAAAPGPPAPGPGPPASGPSAWARASAFPYSP